MKQFQRLQQLFGFRPANTESDDALELAVAQVIDGTESRIRLVPGYSQQLAGAVRAALDYIDEQVAMIPPPLDVDPKYFVSNPQLNSLFVNVSDLQDTFSNSAELNAYYQEPGNREHAEVYALLCVNQAEKTRFGTVINGDQLQRDVQQTVVNFSKHKVLSPAQTEAEVRQGLKNCIFAGLITHTLQHIVQLKTEKRELEDRQRMLHARLRSRVSRQSGLDSVFSNAQPALEDAETLQHELMETEEKLRQLPPDTEVLRYYLKEIADVVRSPERFIRVEVVSHRLTRMGVKVDEASDEPAYTIELAEVSIAGVLEHVVTIVRYVNASA